jgi:thymidylate synthase ThyX
VSVAHSGAEALERYTQSMEATWQATNRLLDAGLPFEWASYLLPNALAVRFEESGDLLALHHKWKARSCYTAQEEIFHATVEELKQVKAIHPAIAEHILAPCYLRYHAEITPFCPEGDRFCGVRVWKQGIEDYNRLL